MLLQFTAKVESAAFSDEPFGISVPPYNIDLACDSTNRVVELRVQKQVDPKEIQLPQHVINQDGPSQIEVPVDNPHFNDILNLVQYLESLGSFWFSIRRIYWAEGKYEWVPENEEEQRMLQVFSFKPSFSYPVTPVHVKPDVLYRMVQARSRLSHLTVPLAFFREGVNEFRSFRYVNAFHNLYFFLEGLFGGGKSNNKQVEQQFLSSKALTEAVQEALTWLERPEQHRHKNSLDSLRQMRNYDWSVEGLVALIVWMRGNLHHFSPRSSTPKGHPLNQRDFESIAYLLQIICYRLTAKLAI